jgi:hypothetical protein
MALMLYTSMLQYMLFYSDAKKKRTKTEHYRKLFVAGCMYEGVAG